MRPSVKAEQRAHRRNTVTTETTVTMVTQSKQQEEPGRSRKSTPEALGPAQLDQQLQVATRVGGPVAELDQRVQQHPGPAPEDQDRAQFHHEGKSKDTHGEGGAPRGDVWLRSGLSLSPRVPLLVGGSRKEEEGEEGAGPEAVLWRTD